MLLIQITDLICTGLMHHLTEKESRLCGFFSDALESNFIMQARFD